MPFTDSARTSAFNVSTCTASAPQVDIGFGVPNTYEDIQAANETFVVRNTFVSGQNYGFRLTNSVPVDFSQREYVFAKMVARSFAFPDNIETLDSGGMVIVFIDILGHYKAFNVYGSEALNTLDFVRAGDEMAEGLYTGYVGWATKGAGSVVIARDALADYESATAIDWSMVSAVEVHVRAVANRSGQQYGMCDLIMLDDTEYTGVVPSTRKLAEEFSATNLFLYERDDNGISLNFFGTIETSSAKFNNAFQSIIQFKSGITFGNGIDTTSMDFRNVGISYEALWADRLEYPTPIRGVIVDKDRVFRFNCSPGDAYSLVNCAFASSRFFLVSVSGSPLAPVNFERCTFFGITGIDLAHGNLSNSSMQNCTGFLTVTLESEVVNSDIEASGGVITKDAAGDYRNIGVIFSMTENNLHDITVGEGGSGTYDFSGVTVPSGRTVKVHNESTTNDLVVKLPPGTTTVTSTEGGAILVDVSVVSSLLLTGLIEGTEVAVVRVSDGMVLANIDSISGGSFEYTYTHTGVDELVDVVVFSLGFLPQRIKNLPLVAQGVTIPIQQTADRQYQNL